MKITKMSLVAALLVGSSAFAIENTKVSGDAKLYYGTSDTGTSSLFDRASSAGQAAATLSISTDLAGGVSAGTKVTALTTLGLEGQLVGSVWEAPNALTDTFIVNDLWIAATAGKTTAKVGRMALDTPLVFTETWSIVENTFESAVLINTDVPHTTIVAAYVGGSNGDLVTKNGFNNVINPEAANSTFSQFYKGAYAVGAINNSWAPLTAQAWYYDASSTAKAYWLQADLAMEGFLVGAQFTGTDLTQLGLADKGTAFALMAGYEMKDMFTAKVSYSQTSDNKTDFNGVGTVGANLAGSGQSKLYTEAWWNYGKVTRANTSSFHVAVEGSVAGIDLGAYGTISQQKKSVNAGIAADDNMNEGTLTASKSMGPVDVTAAYILDNNQNSTDYENTLQAYLTYNF